MGRQLRTLITVMASTLQPGWDESKQLRGRQENIKTRYTVYYDRYHRVGPLYTFCAGDRDKGYSGRQSRHASFVSCTYPDDMSTKELTTSVPTPIVTLEPILTKNRVTEESNVKEALYRIWCGANRLGDGGVHTHGDNSAFDNPAGQLLYPGGVRPEWMASA